MQQYDSERVALCKGEGIVYRPCHPGGTASACGLAVWVWSGGGVSSVESESESMGRGRAVKGHIGYKNTPRRKPVARRSDQRRAASGRCARTSPPTPPQPLSDRRTTLRTTPRGRRPRHSSNRSSPWQLARSATQRPRRATTRIFSNTYCFNTPTSPPSLNTTIA